MILNDKFFHMAGLAVRAGKCVFGAEACEKAIKNGTARLILLDGGVSEATAKRFSTLCAARKVQTLFVEPEGELGYKTGKPAGKIFAIMDKNFANQLVCIYKKSCLQQTGGVELE